VYINLSTLIVSDVLGLISYVYVGRVVRCDASNSSEAERLPASAG
jgi:hypothetical protein